MAVGVADSPGELFEAYVGQLRQQIEGVCWGLQLWLLGAGGL